MRRNLQAPDAAGQILERRANHGRVLVKYIIAKEKRERLLAIRINAFDQVSEDVVVQNFFEELREVVPD